MKLVDQVTELIFADLLTDSIKTISAVQLPTKPPPAIIISHHDDDVAPFTPPRTVQDTHADNDEATELTVNEKADMITSWLIGDLLDDTIESMSKLMGNQRVPHLQPRLSDSPPPSPRLNSPKSDVVRLITRYLMEYIGVSSIPERRILDNIMSYLYSVFSF